MPVEPGIMPGSPLQALWALITADEGLLVSVMPVANVIVVALHQCVWFGLHIKASTENFGSDVQHGQTIQLGVSRSPLHIVEVIGAGL